MIILGRDIILSPFVFNRGNAFLEKLKMLGNGIVDNVAIVGAAPHVCPYNNCEPGNPEKWGEHAGSPLKRVMQWFKTMTTNAYIRGVKNLGWKRFNGKLWQRNYYEIIIRNEKSYHTITQYILKNPSKWKGRN